MLHVTVRQLRLFVAVVHHKSFVRAAEELMTTKDLRTKPRWSAQQTQ